MLYWGIFRGLRKWEEMRKEKLKSNTQLCQTLQEAAVTLPPLASFPPPLPPVIENDFINITMKELHQDPEQDSPFAKECKDGPIASLAYTDGAFCRDQSQDKKRAKINGRERKAMRVLPVVVGESV